MALRGSIETMSVGELFDWLDRRLCCGVLTLQRGILVRRFHIDSGYITLASSSEQKALLGQILVERGLLSPNELERALRAGRETGTRLGRVLTLVGAVPESTMQELLTQKVRSMVADALSWTDGRFVFDDSTRAPKARPLVSISVNLRDSLMAARLAPAETVLSANA